jgi:Putative phage tail protein
MATLVLGAVGGLIGGPIGAALGAAIGNRIDQRLLAPKGRRGPRLNDLSVQSSTYGSAIPKIFGAMRVSGTVIWSTDLIENRKKQGNGKGRPKTTVYSYSASFAVALSARPIARVGRIWADGKLLRGEAGDFKTETGFRLHIGSGDQPVDPLIAAAEGAGATPAYRGIAYAVFEEFQLGDYGNRIPSLSFEVFGDDGSVSLGIIARELAPEIVADMTTAIGGFAAEGDSVRGALEVLSGVFPLSLNDDGASLTLRDSSGLPIVIATAEMGATSEARRTPPISIVQKSAAQQPEALSIAYYDAARDYLPATQIARRDGGARRTERVDLPATLDASMARRFCEARLSRNWAERVAARIALPLRRLALGPGMLVSLPAHPGNWLIRSIALSDGIVEIDVVRHSAATVSVVADPGRHLGEADVAHGPTTLVVLDLPPLSETASASPQIAVAAAGVEAGWRRAALSVSSDGGISWQDAGITAAPAIIGAAVSVLPAGPVNIIDAITSVDIELLNAAMDLNDADMAALLRGENMALIGAEAIQFGRAVPLSPGRWRLSQLLRGRRGTEHAIHGHLVGDCFVLLDPDSFAPIASSIGASIAVMATGIADPVPPVVSTEAIGNAVRPLSICHLRAELSTNGDTHFRWVRRSRSGWAWPDGVDAPLGEEQERYGLVLVPNAGPPRTYEVSAPVHDYPANDRAADMAAGATEIAVNIRQLGQYSRSLPETIILPL